MGRSVRVVAIAAAMLISFPAAAFADTGDGRPGATTTADCPTAGTAPGGGAGSGGPATGGDGSAGSGKPGASAAPGAAGPEGDGPSGGGSGDDQGSSNDHGSSGGDHGSSGDGSGSGDGGSGGDDSGSGGDGGSSGSGGSGDDAGSGSGDDRGSGSGSGSDQGSGSGGDSGDTTSGAGDSGTGDTTQDSTDDRTPGGDQGSGDDQGSGGDKSPGDGTTSDPGSGDDTTSGGDGAPNGDRGPAGDQGDRAGAPGSPADTTSANATPGTASGGAATTPAGEPAPGATPAPVDCTAGAAPAAPSYPGAATTAAVAHGWGEPTKVDDFDGDALTGWSPYDGPGHAGKGTRSPSAISVKDGLLTIDGDADGTTGGMAWSDGSQKYGRWEGRVRAPASDPSYNALLLLWPTAENFPVGGEIDFMEMTDHTRQRTNLFLHYGEDNSQVQGSVDIDATQWHNWAVEWTPKGVTAFVDGKQWWHTDDTSVLPPGPMHLTIQLDWFPKGGGDVKPSQMQVDWVRQYALPESGKGGDGSGDAGGDDEGLLDGLLHRITEGGPDREPGSATRGASGT
ncbi:family 16 glycosylhydrolase [Pseudonocardia alni]|uniref:glycoside hydrolase family 16 protein n=1 Tax=Pseudonocardia alni TaxID=33907 RepID=UPI0027985F98|nr:family 16 glycosylhydrolase [Pseudonocardia alni]